MLERSYCLAVDNALTADARSLLLFLLTFRGCIWEGTTQHIGAVMSITQAAAPSFTLNEWLQHRRLSRAQWYRMPPDERPDTHGIGRMQRISGEADARWLRRQERKAKQLKAAS